MKTQFSFLDDQRRSRRSSALIISMLLVSLVTVLLVGFVASMRMEIFSARSHLNGVKASFYAQAAQDMAVSRLHYALSSTNNSWVTRPGQVITWPIGVFNATTNGVDLSSNPAAGPPAMTATDDLAADLNVKLLEGSSGNLVAYTNAVMKVQWLYVHQDGAYESAPPTNTSSNPVVGRFAFWVDDASTRINVNTAWTNNPAYPASYPGRINLGVLNTNLPSLSDDVKNFRLTSHYFNTAGEFSKSNSVINTLAAWQTNRFAITHYNHSLEWNMFNQPRILLTTKQSLAENAYGTGTTNYFNFVTLTDGDPGTLTALNAASVSSVVARISNQLKRTDWPFMTTSASFAGKFTPIRPEQIALNIIDYVRAAESTNSIVEPTWGALSGTTFTLTGTSANLLMGNNRGPRITELGVSSTAPAGSYLVRTELYLPSYFGLGSIDLSTLTLTVYMGYTSGAVSVSSAIIASEASSMTLTAGGYVAVSRTLSATTGLATVSLAANLISGSRYVDVVPLAFLSGTTGVIPCAVSATQSMAVNDPCVNRNITDWVQVNRSFGGPNTFSSTLGTTTTVSGTPAQDRVSSNSGALTDVSMRMPAPVSTSANATVNTLGAVGSVGELGYIHTGNECSAGAGVPWRTIRLQPQAPTATYIPDWAILDLFAAPVTVLRTATESAYVWPSSEPNSVGGRINIDMPLAAVTNSAYFQRLTPMIGLLQGAQSTLTATTVLSTTTASNMVYNIYYRSLSSTNLSEMYGTNFYFSPLQIAEVKGVTDAGEATESRIRDIASLITARGNVFIIYSVGQVIKQDKTGAMNIMGEHRSATVVERIQSGNSGKLQIVSSQNLTP